MASNKDRDPVKKPYEIVIRIDEADPRSEAWIEKVKDMVLTAQAEQASEDPWVRITSCQKVDPDDDGVRFTAHSLHQLFRAQDPFSRER